MMVKVSPTSMLIAFRLAGHAAVQGTIRLDEGIPFEWRNQKTESK
jgi:hypothetical protein